MYFIIPLCAHSPVFNNDNNTISFDSSYNFSTLDELKTHLISFNWFDNNCELDDEFDLNAKNKYINDIINELLSYENNSDFIGFYERLTMNDGCCHLIVTYVKNNTDKSCISILKQVYDKFEQSLKNFFNK